MRKAVMPIAFGLAAAMWVLGCIRFFRSVTPPPIEYDIHISRRFVPEQRNIIMGAALEWQYSAPGLSLNIMVGGCVEDSGESTICIRPGTQQDLIDQGCPSEMSPIGCEGHHGGVIEIRVVTTTDDIDFARVIRHELGHAFGLAHADQEDYGHSVMALSVGNDSDHVTCRDVKEFWRLRHTSRECLAF